MSFFKVSHLPRQSHFLPDFANPSVSKNRASEFPRIVFFTPSPATSFFVPFLPYLFPAPLHSHSFLFAAALFIHRRRVSLFDVDLTPRAFKSRPPSRGPTSRRLVRADFPFARFPYRSLDPEVEKQFRGEREIGVFIINARTCSVRRFHSYKFSRETPNECYYHKLFLCILVRFLPFVSNKLWDRIVVLPLGTITITTLFNIILQKLHCRINFGHLRRFENVDFYDICCILDF